MTDETDKPQVTEKKTGKGEVSNENPYDILIDQAISISAYESLRRELEAVKAELIQAKAKYDETKT